MNSDSARQPGDTESTSSVPRNLYHVTAWFRGNPEPVEYDTYQPANAINMGLATTPDRELIISVRYSTPEERERYERTHALDKDQSEQ